jgi:hypothetical protein
MKTCPSCSGIIQDDAIKCRHCKAFLSASHQAASATIPARTSLGDSWALGPTPRENRVSSQPLEAQAAPLAEESMPSRVPPEAPAETATSGQPLIEPTSTRSAGVDGWRKLFALVGVVFAFPFFLTLAGWYALGVYRKWKAGEEGEPRGLIAWGAIASVMFVVAVVTALADSSTVLIVTITGLTLIHLLAVAILLFYAGAHIPLVGRYAALAALALMVLGVQAAYRFSYETFAEDVSIEAAWHANGDSAAYTATVHNHMGRTLSFHCVVTANPVGEPGLEAKDWFMVEGLADDTSRTVHGELRGNRAGHFEFLPELDAECSPA